MGGDPHGGGMTAQQCHYRFSDCVLDLRRGRLAFAPDPQDFQTLRIGNAPVPQHLLRVTDLEPDSLAALLDLAAAGIADIHEAQRAVLAGLSAAEVEVLAAIKSRLDAAGGEVEGHIQEFGGDEGGVFW